MKKILLIQLYSNGDCLYATAVARQIKEDYPGCHLTWAVASFCRKILDNNTYVDAVREVEIAKDNIGAFRKFRKEMDALKSEGVYDLIFQSQIIDLNLANYDGCTRSSIFRGYPRKITVPVTPVLCLTQEEHEKVDAFAATHSLATYDHVVLFEFAPLSGQVSITREAAIRIAEAIVAQSNTAVILSSANSIMHSDKAIIDGSPLSLRETAALTHHCTFLLGCSSGITWISTSDAGKLLPMVQILNCDGVLINPVSRDFERVGLPLNKVIELLHFTEEDIIACMLTARTDFDKARTQFNQPVPLNFRTTRLVVYNAICYFEFGAILKHIKVTREVYGDRSAFYMQLIAGFVLMPFTLVRNFFRKKILRRK